MTRREAYLTLRLPAVRFGRVYTNPNQCGRTTYLYGTIYLHSRAFLPAAAGKSVAGIGRTSGFGLALSRLERADHGRMLRSKRDRADPQRPRPDFRDYQ